jgi:hypothetical protein
MTFSMLIDAITSADGRRVFNAILVVSSLAGPNLEIPGFRTLPVAREGWLSKGGLDAPLE